MGKLKEKADKLKSDIPAVYLALKNKKTPFSAKFFAVLAVFYALSPVDLIPDFIPLLGCLDDIVILPLLIMLTVKFIRHRDRIHRQRRCGHMGRNENSSGGMWQNGRPKKWYFAIPVLFFWLLIIFLIIKCFI